MGDILNKDIVLKLNKHWKVCGECTVADALTNLYCGVVLALDINYKLDVDGNVDRNTFESVIPVEWNDWIQLPIRSWDDTVNTAKMQLRVPTIVITKKYDEVPEKEFQGTPTKEALWFRDGGIDGYTGKMIYNINEASVEHIIPHSNRIMI